MQVFGGTNPNQFFSMLMPATTLDQASYAYDTTSSKPALVATAESLLVDQMFDIAKVTGSSNGQRVSSQYMQALSVLVPNFDPIMPVMQSTLREFINSPAPPNAIVDGKPFSGSLQEYYFALYERWLKIKSKWDTEVIAQKDALTEEKFLEWFEGAASGNLARIDAAMGEILAVFSPADMDAILGALEAGPGGEIEEALATVQDIRFPSPSGGYSYPIDLIPDNWFLDLASDMNPVDLLQDPSFIAATISARRQAIMASISQIQAMIAQEPTPEDMKAAADKLTAAQKAYTDAQSKLLNTYAANTATAVEMYLDAETGGAASALEAGGKEDEILKELDSDANAVSKAKGEPEEGATKKDGSALTANDVEALLKGQQTLISAQSSLLTSSQALAAAGMNLASDQAQTFGGLPVMLARLNSQLSELQILQGQVTASAAANIPAPAAVPTALMTAAQAVIDAINTKKAVSATTVTEMITAITGAIKSAPTATQSALAAISSAADEAGKQPNPTADSVATAAIAAAAPLAKGPSTPTTNNTAPPLPPLNPALTAAAQAVVTAINTAANAAGAKPTDITTAITTAIGKAPSATTQSDLKAIGSAATEAGKQPNPTADSVAKAAIAVANRIAGAPSAEKALTSDRYMSLKFSFTSSDMESTSSTNTQFSQLSWGVDLFFGSASGQNSSSSAVSSNHAFDSNTAIEIGLQAAKVDVSRGWFDPGVFKLSKEMSRLSEEPVSMGPVDFSKGAIQQANDAILPCFPVAFVVAKDVSIRFKASTSSLSAVQSVIDSRSAAGGGFLCFTTSASSASHSDNSSLSSKSDGTVITINMPGPQILGWFIEFTPLDKSARMTADGGEEGELSIIEFVTKLKRFSASAKDAANTTQGAHAANGNNLSG